MLSASSPLTHLLSSIESALDTESVRDASDETLGVYQHHVKPNPCDTPFRMRRQHDFGSVKKSFSLSAGQGCRRIGKGWPRLHLNDRKKSIPVRDHINLTSGSSNATGQYIPPISLECLTDRTFREAPSRLSDLTFLRAGHRTMP
jgi:hypothetical protein